MTLVRAQRAQAETNPCRECGAENGWHKTECLKHPRFVGSANMKQPLLCDNCHQLMPSHDRLAHADEDGHCSICGLPWPDERETLEPHVCPPGFQRGRLTQCPVVWGPEKQAVPGGQIYRVGSSTGVTLPPHTHCARASHD